MAVKRRLVPRTVRGRATAASCLMVGVFMVVASVAFLTLLRRTLIDEVDQSAAELVNDLALEATQDLLPDLSAAPEEGNLIIQVIEGDGRVVESSPNLVGAGPIARFAGRRVEVRTLSSPVEGEDGPFRVAGLSAVRGDETVSVYVGRSLASVDRDILIAGTMLSVGLPLLVALVGVTTWVLVGRSLRPVEHIRAEVADITGTDLHRRVPETGAGDEVGRLAITMNEMLDRLEGSADRQRRFVGDAAHELQSPLAVLRAELEVALGRPETADWPGVGARLLGDVARQERLVQDLLYLARADAEQPPRADRVVDLDGVVLDEVERVRSRSSIPVDTAAVSAAPVRGRSEDLARVIANLLDNAVRHATRSVKVQLTVREPEAILVVHDDGPGIPPPLRAQIFERFARLDEGRSRDRGGTGLGLAIAREIIEAHGGTITAEDAAVGARLVVRLPAEV